MSTDQWYVRLGDDQLGPMSQHDIDSLASKGVISSNTLVSRDAETWQKASSAGLVAVAAPQASSPPPPPPPPPPDRRGPSVAAESAPDHTFSVAPQVTPRRQNTGKAAKRQHRGDLIMWLGSIGFLLAASFPCVLGLIGLPIGLMAPVAWIMGQRDLSEMYGGRMNSRGIGKTKIGMINGILGTLFLVFWVFIILVGSAA